MPTPSSPTGAPGPKGWAGAASTHCASGSSSWTGRTGRCWPTRPPRRWGCCAPVPPSGGHPSRTPSSVPWPGRPRHGPPRLGGLVSELLDLTGLQGGEPLPEPAPVSVDRIVAEVIDRTRTPASAKGLEVGFVGMRGLTVYGSESQLMTAVANLAENAVAYSPDAEDGKPAPRVTITARGDDDLVEIAVIDQGIGIEPKDLDRTFERFYRT